MLGVSLFLVREVESSIIDFVQLRSERKKVLLKVEGHVPQYPIAGDANAYNLHLIVDNSDMGLKPTSFYMSTHDETENYIFKSVFTYLLT